MHIYVDEKGIQTEHISPFIISADKTVPTLYLRFATTKTLGCGKSLEIMLPPFYIFKGKMCRNELLGGAMTSAPYVITDSGWSNASLTLVNHFLKYVQRGNIDQMVFPLFEEVPH